MVRNSGLLPTVLVTQLCPTLCDTVDSSPPGSSVHGILQVRILEWLPFPSSRNLPDPGIEPRSSALQANSLPSEASNYLPVKIQGLGLNISEGAESCQQPWEGAWKWVVLPWSLQMRPQPWQTPWLWWPVRTPELCKAAKLCLDFWPTEMMRW